MTTAYVIVAIATMVANAAAAIADFAGAEFVRKTSAELGISETWLPLLGVLKAAGAVGLLVGLLEISWIGIAAAVGLVLFFVGALIFHFRARVFHNFAAPATYLALAVASLVLALAI
ncbi:MAG TPA: DoxX family protein [Mycobacterium sp.]|jgi:hypothetical protein